MTPLSVIRDYGLQIWAEGDKLHISPRDRLNDELRAYIKQHKPEIIAVLQTKDNRWNPELAVAGYVWCLDCVHWQSVETQQAMIWKYADQSATCAHPGNPHKTQNLLSPRKCRRFDTKYAA